MRIEVYRYTTLLDIKDGVLDPGESLEPQTDALRIVLGDELKSDDFDAILEAANKFMRVRVVLSRSCNWAWDQLHRFHSLWGVQAYGLTKDSVAYMQDLPSTIRELEIGVNSGLSKVPSQLNRFSQLTRLSFSGKLKGIDTFTEFPKLSELQLSYVSQIDMNELRDLTELRILKITHGSVQYLPKPDALTNLEELVLWKTRGVDHLDWIVELIRLQRLELGALPGIEQIPDLRRQTVLENVVIDQMKGLKSLSALAGAPKLQTLHAKAMNQIDVDDYRAFENHPTLSALTSGYSSSKKNKQVSDFIGKPAIQHELYANTREF